MVASRPTGIALALLSQCQGARYGYDMPPTKRRTPQRTVAIDDELWNKCLRIAEIRRENMADVLRRAAVEYADKYGHLLDSGDPHRGE